MRGNHRFHKLALAPRLSARTFFRANQSGVMIAGKVAFEPLFLSGLTDECKMELLIHPQWHNSQVT